MIGHACCHRGGARVRILQALVRTAGVDHRWTLGPGMVSRCHIERVDRILCTPRVGKGPLAGRRGLMPARHLPAGEACISALYAVVPKPRPEGRSWGPARNLVRVCPIRLERSLQERRTPAPRVTRRPYARLGRSELGKASD